MNERMFTDTTEFCSIDFGDMIQIGGKRYLVKGHEHEEQFGMEDPKLWVKKAIDLDKEEKKIIKLSFLESFDTSIAGIKIKCFRNPDKESEILDLVKGHPHFMNGKAYRDEKNNNIRILDVVRGTKFIHYIDSMDMGYETYFHNVLPGILERLLKAFEAIRFLHINGHKHGDIRTDHLIVEQGTGNYVWIDFDYDYVTSENPFSLDLFELGNILLYAVGKGFHDLSMIKNDTFTYGDLRDYLEPGDFSILHQWRFINLGKLYPFIPAMLNNILLHFSRGTDVFYEGVEEIIEDLNLCLHSMSGESH